MVNITQIDNIARTERVVTPRKTKDGGQEPIETPYWAAKTPSTHAIPAPPDLTGRLNLNPGDIFIHRMQPRGFQLWLWTPDDEDVLRWMPVRYGYRRADGRALHVTPTALVPGWVRGRLNYGECTSIEHDVTGTNTCAEMKRLDAYHVSRHA